MARRGKGKGKGKAGLSFAQRAAAIRQVANDITDAGMHVTDTIRSAASRLGRRNPKSQHIQAMAFDTRAKTPAQADAVMAQQRALFDAKGLVYGRDYTFIDEVRNPSGWATAKHVHTQFTPAGLARYQGVVQPDAATNVAANVPTPTARPAQPGDIDPFGDTTYSPEAEATAAPGGLRSGFRTAMGGAAAQGAFQAAVNNLSSGLRPGFTGSAVAPSVAASGPGTIGGLLGRPSAGLGFMPGSGALAPTTAASLRSRSPAPSPESGKAGRVGASDEPSDPDRFGGIIEPSDPNRFGGLLGRPGVNEAGSPTPDLDRMGVMTPGLLGQPTAVAEASSLPDRAPTPTLADRAVRESITSALPDQGPTLADRPDRTVAAAQPATPDVVDALADEDTDAVVSTGAKTAVAKLGTSEATGAGTTDTGLDASPDGPLDVEPLDKGAHPPASDAYKPGILNPDAYETGIGQIGKNAFKGLMRAGPVGGLLGGLGTLAMQNMPSGFNEAVPESSRFSVGSGLSGINAALSGPKGATATSRTQKGASVTSLGNGQSLRRSDRYGWTEVVGPDGSVVGIQYDNPTGKGILGKGILGSHQGLFGWASNKAGSTFGGSNGLSPSASRAIRDGTDGGLY